MTTAQKITSFGLQSLDSSVFNQMGVDDPGPRPIMRLIELDDGTIYDGNYGGNSTLQPPDRIQVELMVKDATRTAATFNTALENLRDLQGTTADLTGEDIEGNTLTMSAHCLNVPIETTPSTFEHFWQQVTLTFKPLENWN